jgi:hypothetical protein
MRLRGRLAWAALVAAALFAACDLNPQPLPPGDENPNKASADNDGGIPAIPHPEDGGSSGGGGVNGEDASSDGGIPPAPGDAGSDGADGGDASDATTD